MKCKYCGRRLGIRQVLGNLIRFLPWWRFCNYDCWIGYTTFCALITAMIPPLEKLAKDIENEMDATLKEIEERVKELSLDNHGGITSGKETL